MTLKELSELTRQSIEVRSAYDGKILCKAYNEKKHSALSDHVIISIWSEIRTDNTGYNSFAKSVICVYVLSK